MLFDQDAAATLDQLLAYVESSRAANRPVLRQDSVADLIDRMELQRHAREGSLGGEALQRFISRYLECSTALHHPGYMAHQVSVPNLTGSLAGLMDGVTNNAMSVYEMGPTSAAIEFFIINWMLEKIGRQPAPADGSPTDPPCGGGVLTHGGSLANLTALAAARNRFSPEAWHSGAPADLAIMASPMSHYSVSRTASIMGIGRQGIIELETDSRGAILPDRLPHALEAARTAGKRPFALVANACSTAVGIYDPLPAIARFCADHGIWLHVDGAHGAGALLSPTRRRLLEGIDQADSVTWDAHKLMQCPILCAGLLVRNHLDIDRTFQQEASYLFHDQEHPGVDFGERSFECTKAGLGLRFFMTLGALGEEGIGRFVDRQCDLAAAAYELISATPGFECAVRPESNILCFRVQGDDALQMRIRATILAEGNHYFSSAMFGGRRWLRIVLLNPLAELHHIEALVRRVAEVRAAMVGTDPV